MVKNPRMYEALTALMNVYHTAITGKPYQDDTLRVLPYKNVPFAVVVEYAKNRDVFAAAKAIGAEVEGNIIVMPPATVRELGNGTYAVIPHVDDSLFPESSTPSNQHNRTSGSTP